jgi:amino acid transporter
MTSVEDRRPSLVLSTLAANRLGIPHVVFFVITAAAPLTVVAGIVSVGWSVTDVTGLPLAFLLVAVVLGLFCVGFVAVARRVRNAGAFYSYIAQGLGKPLGVGAAMVALAAYGAMQVCTYGAIGAVTATLLHDKLGGYVPWWLIALAAWAIVGILGVLRVDVNGRILAAALVAEVALVAVLDLVALAHPAGGHVSLAALAPDSLSGGGLGVALAIVVTGYIGFEAAPVFSEESRASARTVPAAAYLSLALMAVLYAGSAWAMSVAIGPTDLHTAAQTHGTNLPFAIAAPHLGGDLIVDIGHVLLVNSLLAAALSYHNTVARYAFALGRERVLPAWLGRTSARSGAPKYASLTHSAVGLAVIAGYAISGADPLVTLFYRLGTTGGFGVLLLVTTTSVSVIGFFARRRGNATTWQRLIAPALASVGLAAIAYLILTNVGALLGVPPSSPLRWMFPTGYAVLAAAGSCWALHLRRNRPDVYAAIGLGAPAPLARSARYPSNV